MLLRAVSVCLLLALSIPPCSSAGDVLDYKQIGPVQIVQRIALTLVEGSGGERRSATEEAHGLGEIHLQGLGVDGAAAEYFSLAGEALIPLFWTSKSTTRVRSERILAEIISGLSLHATSTDAGKRELAIELLERYAALMMVAPGNASSGKLLEEVRLVFEEANHEFAVTPATEFTSFEGLSDPDPARGKNEGERTVAVAKPKEPIPASGEQIAEKAVSEVASSASEAVRVKPPVAVQATRVVSASGKDISARRASARRVAVKPQRSAGGAAITRVSAKRVSGVTGAVGEGGGATTVVSFKASPSARAGGSGTVARVSAKSFVHASSAGSPAALRILRDQLQSDNEERLLSAFGLAETLYAQIRHSANAGVGAARETAQKIIVRARMLVGSPTASVRKAAIPMVAELGDDGSVGQLIRLLPEKQTGVDRLALDALKKLTGEDFGYSVDKWLKWHASERGKP